LARRILAYGKVLLDCGNVVFDEMRQGIRQIEFLTSPDSGDPRVGFPEVEIAGIVPAIMQRFIAEYPRVRLEVIHARMHRARG
jgi:DNA-binding transcriptional LysR family regulator